MTMIKCPACRHHISSMAKACPECGHPIDPEWAQEEAERELKKLQEVPFTVEVGGEEEQPQTTPPAKPEKGGRAVRYLVPVVLLGMAVGGLYLWDYRQGLQREQRAYELLQDCSNPDFYEDFIIRFPRSKHIEEVRERYKVMAARQSEWQKLVENGTRDELNRFVREHPTSPYVKVAQGRIDSLDWTEARRLRTLEAVTFYLATHPNGYYVDQADVLRQTLERQRAEAEALAAAQRDSLALTDSAAVANPENN